MACQPKLTSEDSVREGFGFEAREWPAVAPGFRRAMVGNLRENSERRLAGWTGLEPAASGVTGANADCDSRHDLRICSVSCEICRSEAVVERHGPTRFCEEKWHTYRHSARFACHGVTKAAEAVLAEKLRLNVKAREEVATELLASLGASLRSVPRANRALVTSRAPPG
jgi:hypothetical protein